MHMIPVTDQEELAAISAWSVDQKVDPLVPGWATWKFVDDSGKFYGFYQHGPAIHAHFHVDYSGDKTRSIRAIQRVEALVEALGVAPLVTLPDSSPMYEIVAKRYPSAKDRTFVVHTAGGK